MKLLCPQTKNESRTQTSEQTSLGRLRQPEADRHTVPAPQTECLINSTVAEQLPGAVTDAAGWLDSWMGEQASGGPEAGANPEANTLTETLAPGASHAPDTTARSWVQPTEPSGATQLLGGLKDGRIGTGIATEQDFGPMKLKANRTLDVMAAQTGGMLGVSRDAVSGEQGLTVQGAIDLGWDGVQALMGAAELSGFGATLGAGAGHVDTVGPVEEEEGKFSVTWSQGAASSVTGGMDGLGGKAEVGAGQVLTRTFDTREEAEAFRAQAGAGQLQSRISAAEVMGMQAGESFDYSAEVGLGGEGSLLAAAGISAGLEGKLQHQLRIEKVGEHRVKLTEKDGWQAKGKGGAGCFAASYEGWGATGHENADEIELDLSKPGVQAVFDAYLATGMLPERLPDGVERAKGTDMDTKAWGNTSRLGLDTYSTDSGTKVGSYYDGDLEGERVEGHSHQEHTRMGLGGSSLVSSEKHDLWAETDGDRKIHGQSVSEYRGRGAAARVADHLSSRQNLPDTARQHGTEGGNYRITHELDPDTVDVLGRSAATTLAGQAGTPLTAYDSQIGDSMGRWAEGALFDPIANLGRAVADEGRDGVEWLMQQTKGDVTRVENLDTGLGDAEAVASIEKQLALLESSETVDPAAVKALRWDIASQQIAMGADVTAVPEARDAVAARLNEISDDLDEIPGVN